MKTETPNRVARRRLQQMARESKQHVKDLQRQGIEDIEAEEDAAALGVAEAAVAIRPQMLRLIEQDKDVRQVLDYLSQQDGEAYADAAARLAEALSTEVRR